MDLGEIKSSTGIFLVLLVIVPQKASVGELNVSATQRGMDLERESNCTCYSYSPSLSCHCNGQVSILIDILRYSFQISSVVELNCAKGKISDPYQYLPYILSKFFKKTAYFQSKSRPYVTSYFSLQITGCPSPEEDYFSWITSEELSRDGGRKVVRDLRINCGGVKEFSIERRHFTNSSDVKNLEVDCQSLKHLPHDAFFELTGENAFLFGSIGIRNTAMKSLSLDVFSRLVKLPILSLTGNKLLESLTLSSPLKELNTLNIRENGLYHLDEDIFDSTPNILLLIMNGNFISKLPRSVCRLKQLIYIYAHDNRIQHVMEGCFVDLDFIEIVNLSGNRLINLDFLGPLGSSIPSSHSPQNEAMPTEHSPLFQNYSLAPRLMSKPRFKRASEDVSPKPARLTHEEKAVFLMTIQMIQTEFEQRYVQFDSHSVTSTHGFHNPKKYKMNVHKDNQVIVLHMNDLASVHESAFIAFTHLIELDLSFNRLRTLPEDILRKNTLLKFLNVSHNYLTDISQTLLSNNRDLQVLDLSSNRIVSLGEQFFSGVPNLTHLDLSNNTIASLPKSIFLPLNLNNNSENPLILDLEGNTLTMVPSFDIARLTEINLASNYLTRLPTDTFNGAHSLERINVSFNNMTSSTNQRLASIDTRPDRNLFHSGLRKLNSIDMSHNRLSITPFVYPVRESLKFLNLSGNPIDGGFFNTDAFRAPRLEVLDLSWNKKFFCGDPFSIWSVSELRWLRHLDLSWNNISFVNCSIITVNRLRETCYPHLEKLLRLEVLKLDHNAIAFVPVRFERLTKLRLVDLSHNRIKRISHRDLFFARGVTKDILTSIGESEDNYVQRGGDYFEINNARQLTIDLRYNEIGIVELSPDKTEMVNGVNRRERRYSRATMHLGHNPYVCGCQVFDLLRYAQMELGPVHEEEAWRRRKYVLPVKIDISDLHCSEPQSMLGKNLSGPETWMHHLLPMYGMCQLLDLL